MTGARILLVDDEEVFTRNMTKLLTHRGYVVTAVSSGDSAVRNLQDQAFDVIVLDLKMPGMDGIATLKEIRKLDLLTEVVILTGHGSMDTAFKAIEMGAYDYVTKPCEIADLVAKIEAALARKKVKEEKR
jgi:DNA-binding NtrC family response regulator